MSRIQTAEILLDFNELEQRVIRLGKLSKTLESEIGSLSKHDVKALYRRTFELYAKSEDIQRKIKKLINK